MGQSALRLGGPSRDGSPLVGRALRRTFELVDPCRVDHFRGFVSYWPAPPRGNRTRRCLAARPGPSAFDAARIELARFLWSRRTSASSPPQSNACGTSSVTRHARAAVRSPERPERVRTGSRITASGRSSTPARTTTIRQSASRGEPIRTRRRAALASDRAAMSYPSATPVSRRGGRPNPASAKPHQAARQATDRRMDAAAAPAASLGRDVRTRSRRWARRAATPKKRDPGAPTAGRSRREQRPQAIPRDPGVSVLGGGGLDRVRRRYEIVRASRTSYTF